MIKYDSHVTFNRLSMYYYVHYELTDDFSLTVKVDII